MSKKDSQTETLADRINEIVARYCEGVGAEFSRKTGIRSGYLSMLRSGERTNLRREKMESICRAFPVNIHWLETGHGEMIIEAPPGGWELRETYASGPALAEVQRMFGWWLKSATREELERRLQLAVDDRTLPAENRNATMRLILDELDRRRLSSKPDAAAAEAARVAASRARHPPK